MCKGGRRGAQVPGGVGGVDDDDVGAGHGEGAGAAAAARRPRAAGEGGAGGGGIGPAAARGGGAGEWGKVRLQAEGEAAGAAAGGVQEGALDGDRGVAGVGHVEPGDGLAAAGEEAAAEHVGGEEGVGVAAAAVAVDRDGAGRGVDGRDEAVEHLRRAGRVGGRAGERRAGRVSGTMEHHACRLLCPFKFASRYFCLLVL